MQFGPVPVTQAAGSILAHSVPLLEGRLRKGKLLGAQDVAALRQAGVAEVVVARLDPGDIGEDDAAARLAEALAGNGISVGDAATGRANLYAEGPGVLGLDPDAVAAVNAVDPAITLATLSALRRVEALGMVATVKIIAYGVAQAHLAAAVGVGRGALRLHPTRMREVALVETTLGGEVPPKGRRAMQMRVERMGAKLGGHRVVAHQTGALAAALGEARGDAVLILTASATSDMRDVAPAALRAAGGEITHFGMPVDPGNLLFLGALGGRPVIGLPGCARSPALNGADWVLERVLCGLEVTARDIAAMGVGGLLKEVPARGRLREPKGPTGTD